MNNSPGIKTPAPLDGGRPLVKPFFPGSSLAGAAARAAGNIAAWAKRALQSSVAALPDGVSRVLLVGDDSRAKELSLLIDAAGPRYRLAGSLPAPASPEAGRKENPDLLTTAKRLRANTLVVSVPERRGVLPLREMLNCKLSGIKVLDAPSLYERLTGKLSVETITPSWLIFNNGFNITPLLRAAKRATDIVCSLAGLLLVLPFAPFLALAVKLDSPGPLFFKQVRVGEGNRPFTIVKLRTMRQDAEKGTGAVWAQNSDPRITRIGKFLRKTRLDEIPQLINVLKGEMSLVGPRPERPEFVGTLKDAVPYYGERHFVKPGLTGWAQVRYRYGASVQDALEKLRYDLYYIKNISLFFDLKILFMTVGVVLGNKGAR